MTIRDIIRMGHPTLRKIAASYAPEKIGSKAFHSLIDDMKETLEASGGIGLAAPQMNVSVQIVIIDVPDSGTRYGITEALPFTIYINPKVQVIEEASAGYWEGCLSIPGMMGFVERPQHIVVDYLSETGEKQSLELKGFLATVFQHELDHLQGRLYIDHIKDLSLFTYENEYREFHLEEG
ncbi:MAG: peptide deformylase [Flavobacterium sp.]|jgi:peptide deformylase